MNDPILRLVVLHMVKSGHISKSATWWQRIGKFVGKARGSAGKLLGHMTGTEARLSKVVPGLEEVLTKAVPKEHADVLAPHLEELAKVLRSHNMKLEGPLVDELAKSLGVAPPPRVKLSPAAIDELRRQIPVGEKLTNLGYNLGKATAVAGPLVGVGVGGYHYLKGRGSTGVVPYKDTYSKPLPVPQPATEQPSTEAVPPPARPGLSHRKFTFDGADAQPASEYGGFADEFKNAPPQQ